MKINVLATIKEDFRAWRESTKRLSLVELEENLSLLGEEYKNVITERKAVKAAIERVKDEFSALLERQPKDTFSWGKDDEIMEAHAAHIGDIERLKTRFDTRYGRRYDEYLNAVNALKKRRRRVIFQNATKAT
jgi:FMN phosphatase YigB (HAD superfamily)